MLPVARRWEHQRENAWCQCNYSLVIYTFIVCHFNANGMFLSIKSPCWSWCIDWKHSHRRAFFQTYNSHSNWSSVQTCSWFPNCCFKSKLGVNRWWFVGMVQSRRLNNPHACIERKWCLLIDLGQLRETKGASMFQGIWLPLCVGGEIRHGTAISEVNSITEGRVVIHFVFVRCLSSELQH